MEFTFTAFYSQEYCVTIEADSFEEVKKKFDDPDVDLEACDKPYLESSYCRDEDDNEYDWNPYDD